MGSVFRTKTKTRQLPTVTPQQRQLIDLLTQLTGQTLQEGFPESSLERNRDLFEQTIASPARQRFEQETLPQLLQQFASSGSFAGSPASAQAASRGLADLEGKLAQAQGQFFLGREQQQQQLPIQLASLALGQKPFETVQTRSPSIGSQLLGLGSQALPFLFL